jgi:hypothetical protein
LLRTQVRFSSDLYKINSLSLDFENMSIHDFQWNKKNYTIMCAIT